MSTSAANAATNALDFSQYAGLRSAAQQNDPAALKKAAQQFEALFTQMMLKSMRDALPGDSTMGAQGDFYTSLYDQQLATSLSSGKGMGLADLLVRQLSQAQAAVADASTGPTAAQRSLGAFAYAGGSRASAASSQDWVAGDSQSFIDAIRPHAEKAARELGVPARAIMAQAALETGWGSHVARDAQGRGYNLFGIKASAGWSGDRISSSTSEFRDGAMVGETADFRAYDSLASSFDDYVQFLKRNPRYAEALKAEGVDGFASGLQKAGYATDPAYAAKLLKVANSANMSDALNASANPARTRLVSL